MCFPPNCTALLQPMDQNVINLTKMFYKKSLLAHLIGTGGSNFEEKIKLFNLRKAICIFFNSWEKVSPTAIKNCWNVLLCPDSQWTEEDLIPLSSIRNEIINENIIKDTTANYLTIITPNTEFTSDEINEWLIENDTYSNETEVVESDTDSDEDVEICVESSAVNNSTAIDCFTTCIQWAEEKNMPIRSILNLQELREKAVQFQSARPTVQTKIYNFFKK